MTTHDPTAELVATICKVEQHYYTYIKNTGVSSYFLKSYEAMKHKEDGHLFFRATERTKDRFLDRLGV